MANEQDLGKILEGQAGKSREELMDALKAQRSALQEEGEWEEEALDEMEAKLSPLLNDAQRKRFAALPGVLRNE